LITSARETGNTDAQAVLADAGQRVAAISAAQKLLYSESRPRSFNIRQFLHEVSGSSRQAFGKEVTVTVDADDSYLTNDLAMPLALILNELLTKPAKHGINGRGTGEILVALHREEGDMVLTVGDDGPGFDMLATGRRSSGLGLVRGMCRQLRGTFEVERKVGARCIIRFPAPHH
jgi:two-component sensor histidine kinase